MTNKPLALLMQLPFPRGTYFRNWGNVPLAAGYLAGFALAQGLGEAWDVELLDPLLQNWAGDELLAQEIVARRPRVLGLTLYYWNSRRSMRLVERVKELLPEVAVIVGGPEVHPVSRYIVDNPAVDAACLGEGELVFSAFLRAIQAGADLDAVPGIVHGRQGKRLVNAPPPPITNLDSIPSPYLSGIIAPTFPNAAILETQRGCPFKCSYCNWRNRPYAVLSAERVIAELEFFLRSGIARIQVCNSNFILSPHFETICRALAKLNSDKRARLVMYAPAERLTPEMAAHLAAVNTKAVNVGLQSANPKTLANVNRKADLEGFVRGVRILNDHGIPADIDLILGLPGDDLASFQESVNFLERHGLVNGMNRIMSFTLLLMPGVSLREEADKWGMEYMTEPPYLLTKAAYLSAEDLEAAVCLIEGRQRPYFAHEIFPPGYVDPIRHDLTTLEHLGALPVEARPSYVVLDFRSSPLSSEDLEVLGRALAPKVMSHLTVHLVSDHPPEDAALLDALLTPLVAANPQLTVNVLLETETAFPVPALAALVERDDLKERIFVDNSRVHFPLSLAVLLPAEQEFDKDWLEELADMAVVFRRVSTATARDPGAPAILAELAENARLYFDVPATPLAQAAEVLSVVQGVMDGRPRDRFSLKKDEPYFRDLAMACAWYGLQGDQATVFTPQHLETVLDLRGAPQLLAPSAETAVDIKAYQILLRGHICKT